MHIENVQLRYSNRTVTLIVYLQQYSDRRVTKKRELSYNEISHPVDSSARVKSPCIQFSTTSKFS